jgi:hypothetical protein
MYASKDWRHGKGRTPKATPKGCLIERINTREFDLEVRMAGAR